MAGRDAAASGGSVCQFPDCGAHAVALVHLSVEPWGGSAVCELHAQWWFERTPLMLACLCGLCIDARTLLTAHRHDADIDVCMGCTGQWTLRTASGATYVLDLDARTALRTSRPVRLGHDADVDRSLRRDGQPVPLLDMEPVRVGEPAVLTLAGLVAGISANAVTFRRTSTVTVVRRHATHSE
jgi:hypothetical protein